MGLKLRFTKGIATKGATESAQSKNKSYYAEPINKRSNSMNNNTLRFRHKSIRELHGIMDLKVS